jgi:hypothetical protein
LCSHNAQSRGALFEGVAAQDFSVRLHMAGVLSISATEINIAEADRADAFILLCRLYDFAVGGRLRYLRGSGLRNLLRDARCRCFVLCISSGGGKQRTGNNSDLQGLHFTLQC